MPKLSWPRSKISYAIRITITKQDVQFVVQQRLLKKTDAQRDIIRQHLSKFTEFFTDMHAKLEDYVSLFPVNPSFFENFQQIRISKSQREVLKTLTGKFQAIFDKDIPETEPGLICYDQYWDDLQAPEMQTDADVRRVTAIMQTVHPLSVFPPKLKLAVTGSIRYVFLYFMSSLSAICARVWR